MEGTADLEFSDLTLGSDSLGSSFLPGYHFKDPHLIPIGQLSILYLDGCCALVFSCSNNPTSSLGLIKSRAVTLLMVMGECFLLLHHTVSIYKIPYKSWVNKGVV